MRVWCLCFGACIAPWLGGCDFAARAVLLVCVGGLAFLCACAFDGFLLYFLVDYTS